MARGNLRLSSANEPADSIKKALAGFNLVLEGELPKEDEYYLWPENVATFNLWLDVQTQWHSDFGRRTGLNYSGVEICMRMQNFRRIDKQVHFRELQAMERATLEEWAEAD